MLVSLDVSSVPAHPAGAGRYVVELARGLASSSAVEPLFLARRDDAERWQALSAGSGSAGSTSAGGTTQAIAPSARPLRLLWEQARLPATLRRFHVDVHHAPHYTMPERTSIPTVVTIHDMTFFDNPEWHERSKVLVFRRAIETAVKKASHLIAVSHDTAHRLQQRFGDVPVTVIPHGIDHERFRPERVEGERSSLHAAGFPDHYVAFVGTIEPRKNLINLIHAFDRIADANPSLNLVIAGRRGWHLDEFDQVLAASQYRNRIMVPGYVDEALVPALLRGAKAVAYPSHFEGFGLPALEALACGAPLVAGKGSALEEVVGDAGILIDSNDNEALAVGLEQALGCDRPTAAKKGGETAARYTWTAAVQKHLEVYAAATT